jgi:hypothetical protein
MKVKVGDRVLHKNNNEKGTIIRILKRYDYVAVCVVYDQKNCGVPVKGPNALFSKSMVGKTFHFIDIKNYIKIEKYYYPNTSLFQKIYPESIVQGEYLKHEA